MGTTKRIYNLDETGCFWQILCFVLASTDTCNSASEVIHSVTILNAILWISKAWMEVKPEAISKCFRIAGVLTE